jgi:CfrBI restriction endonuclease
MEIEKLITSRIISLLLRGEDYRVEVLSLINSEFIEFMNDFLSEVAKAKSENDDEERDWYAEKFLDESLPKDQIAINSGLNMKTISNMFNSSTKELVLKASLNHYEVLRSTLEEFAESLEEEFCNLQWSSNSKHGKLSLVETFLIINTLAVKRAAIRGGAWSAIGKRVEKPLMLTLCEIFQVPKENYDVKIKNKTASQDDFVREIDFYLRKDQINSSQFKCEVKLMGHGNPESADAVIARDSAIFVADKLSDTNKKQLNSLKVKWVELRSENGFMRFGDVLTDLGIPHTKPDKKRLQNLEGIMFKAIGL